MRALLLLLLWAGQALGADRETDKLNIIFVFVDDLGFADFSCTGNTRVRTPHIDRLASEGTLFKQFYVRVLKPAGILKPDVVVDNPEPHRFAQGFGGVVVALGVLALLLGASVVGWALAWVVIVLAALNLFLGFCAGCFVYYQLNRLNVPGFEYSPVGQR